MCGFHAGTAGRFRSLFSRRCTRRSCVVASCTVSLRSPVMTTGWHAAAQGWWRCPDAQRGGFGRATVERVGGVASPFLLIVRIEAPAREGQQLRLQVRCDQPNRSKLVTADRYSHALVDHRKVDRAKLLKRVTVEHPAPTRHLRVRRGRHASPQPDSVTRQRSDACLVAGRITEILYGLFRLVRRVIRNHADLYIMNTDGSQQMPLVRGAPGKYAPDWQPTP
jgi:hypothetical protein